VIQVCLRLFQALELLALQRRLLCMGYARFHFSFAQSGQLHMIRSIRSRFESLILSIRFVGSPFGSSFPKCFGVKIG